ncbi:DUF2381 family protein [Archangium sp.]|uniref:DUF2381 family protein n=1 Tax=Archangium sp. TaxID=1872627 RepID=UPI00286BCCCF|nr:DUF2381 family protein [Archangium sp.]
MRKLLLFRSPLLLVLVASVAVAAVATVREPIERTLILAEHPRADAHKLYVGGRISTVLRFEKPCDPERTKLLAWEGRFERLICSGKTVVLYPLGDLTPEDRFMLLVTLTDGTEIPFTVTAHRQFYGDREIDQQVNVFADRQGYDAVLSSLYRALKSERELREENERYRKEENSIDHAYATLLVNGALKKTPFRPKNTVVIKDGGLDMVVNLFSGEGKAAAVVQLNNTNSDEPWRFGEARLSFDGSSHTARPFALRMNRAEIIPGASGRIAVVADKSAFVSEEGLVDLRLEIFRSDGSQQVVVLLDHRLVRE